MGFIDSFTYRKNKFLMAHGRAILCEKVPRQVKSIYHSFAS